MIDIRAPLVDATDEREIFRLVKIERLARDTANWQLLTDSYWAESVVRVTWFTGSAEEFTRVSREQYEKGRGRGIHVIDPVWTEVAGDRALVESRGQILVRARLGEIEVDISNWCRFFSRVERGDDGWRLRTFDGIYSKDRVEPVDPAATLEIDWAVAAELRPSYRFLDYLNTQIGYRRNLELPGDDRPDLVQQFYAEARDWLMSA
jgi:hypothetical protein